MGPIPLVTIFNFIVYNFFFFTEEGKEIDLGKFKFGIKQFYKGRTFTMETSPLSTCLIPNNIHEKISPFWLVKSSAVFFESSAEKS